MEYTIGMSKECRPTILILVLTILRRYEACTRQHNRFNEFHPVNPRTWLINKHAYFELKVYILSHF